MTSKTGVFKPSIRKACFADLDAVHALDQRLFPPDIRFDMETFYFHLTDPTSTILIAEENKNIGGFLIFERRSSKVGNIVTIDVMPELQRHGIGSKLMEEASGLAQRSGMRWIVLQVSCENLGARKFYEKLGYGGARTLKGYYHGGENAWEMKLELTKSIL